jgi:MFS superfamily molybdate transporter
MVLGGNRFDRGEVAGAFGDLGTLVPFVVGYVAINRLDPQGALLGFGLMALATGLYFRTPMPVQPMKAIATVAVTQAGTKRPRVDLGPASRIGSPVSSFSEGTDGSRSGIYGQIPHGLPIARRRCQTARQAPW